MQKLLRSKKLSQTDPVGHLESKKREAPPTVNSDKAAEKQSWHSIPAAD